MTMPAAHDPIGRAKIAKPDALVADAFVIVPEPGEPDRKLMVNHAFAPASVTLIAPNGAPASALLQALALRLQPVSGTLRLGQADLLALDPAQAGLWRRENLRLASPNLNIPPVRRVLQHIQVSCTEHEPMAAAPRTADLLDRFDRGRRMGTKVGQLAAGSAEAVGIAAALCVLPRILLIDDVTQHMGAQLAGRVMLAVRHQARKSAMIVIAASTDRVVEDFTVERLKIDF